MSLARVQFPSPNYSARGSDVSQIVLHTAEGATTIESLGSFFASPSANASSHVGIDDKAGVIGEYVQRSGKAWTQANANPVCVSAELCAFAEWSAKEWSDHPSMLDNCAQWIAEESKYFGIPITKLTAQQAQGSGKGVCQHNDLGAWGGGHWDCGGSFPINDVISAAKSYASGGQPEEDDLGYPDWYFQWRAWYYNTDRSSPRPASAPADIPDWAWEAGEKDLNFATNHGMSSGERSWIDWYEGGKNGPRPNVPQTIPDLWWNDQKWAAKRG